MAPIDPSPLTTQCSRPELQWAFVPRFSIGPERITSQLNFEDVLRHRRSQRCLKPASLTEVCSVLSAATTCLYSKTNDNLHRARRPAISSGALHPIEIFFLRSSRSTRVFHFDYSASVVSVATASDPSALMNLWMKAERILPDAASTLVILLGRPSVLELAYDNPQSLLWRDGGALLQILSMAAFSIGLGLCPLGILGNELLTALPPASEKLEPIGTAWLGRIK